MLKYVTTLQTRNTNWRKSKEQQYNRPNFPVKLKKCNVCWAILEDGWISALTWLTMLSLADAFTLGGFRFLKLSFPGGGMIKIQRHNPQNKQINFNKFSRGRPAEVRKVNDKNGRLDYVVYVATSINRWVHYARDWFKKKKRFKYVKNKMFGALALRKSMTILI